jgi:hypothetical protein
MCSAALFALFLAGAAQSAVSSGSDSKEAALLGLAVNLPDSAPAALRRRALEDVRRAGVSVFAFELSWRDAETQPGRYDVERVTRSARLLRQSGAVLHLDLPLVNGRMRVVPWDLSALPFDDTKLSRRLGGLLDALGPALLDFSTLSLGNDADTYFADKPDELRAYRRLFDGAVEFLRKKAPRLVVGVATASPTETRAPLVVAALHEKSPVLFYLYTPFLRSAPFTHRGPETLDVDWKAILRAAAGRPVAFTEVSYSSAAENGSSAEKQADFVRRMRRFLQTTERSRLIFARYVPWRDPPPGPAGVGDARAAFFANRGLQKFDGAVKPAWRELSSKLRVPGSNVGRK